MSFNFSALEAAEKQASKALHRMPAGKCLRLWTHPDYPNKIWSHWEVARESPHGQLRKQRLICRIMNMPLEFAAQDSCYKINAESIDRYGYVEASR